MALSIIIDETTYTKIKNPVFAPGVDLIGNTLPINEFAADIVTDDDITAGQAAEWRWDGDLWARYWVVYAERVDENTVHIRAQDAVMLLDAVTLPEVMYDGEPLADALDEIMISNYVVQGLNTAVEYELSSELSGKTVTGFCPEQTARQRLQWVCFACGAYIKTAFVPRITILPLDDTSEIVPLDKTFWRPIVGHEDYVTAIQLTAFTFRQDADAASDANSYTFPLPWVASSQVFTLDNPDVPEGIQDNPLVIDELYLINPDNVSALLTHLAARYFSRTSVQLDAINVGEYAPGDNVIVYAGEQSLYNGYLESEAFRFGKKARATMSVAAAQQMTGAQLRILYMAGQQQIGEALYYLPVGYVYAITNPYMDLTDSGYRRVYRPESTAATGIIASGENVDEEDYSVALQYHENILRVISVDGVEVQTISGQSVGVIS